MWARLIGMFHVQVRADLSFESGCLAYKETKKDWEELDALLPIQSQKKKFHVFLFNTHIYKDQENNPNENKPKRTHQAMMATHNLSKPLNVFTPQAHKPTILNLHPNNVTILSSSISGGNWRVLRQEMCLRDHLQPTETMGLSGPDPKAVATKNPITRMCMCQDKRVPSSRSLTLEFLRGGALSVAKRARLTPHSLDDAECKFMKILWQRGRVEFKDLEVPIPI